MRSEGMELTLRVERRSSTQLGTKAKRVRSVPSSWMVKFISHYVDALAVTSVTSVAPMLLEKKKRRKKSKIWAFFSIPDLWASLVFLHSAAAFSQTEDILVLNHSNPTTSVIFFLHFFRRFLHLFFFCLVFSLAKGIPSGKRCHPRYIFDHRLSLNCNASVTFYYVVLFSLIIWFGKKWWEKLYPHIILPLGGDACHLTMALQ